MNKEKFLNQLERLLMDIPESERREAIEYYQNYFEDAGPEKESQIIEELGSPQEVAASIKKNLFGEDYREGDRETYHFEGKRDAFDTRPSENKTLRTVLIAVIILLTSPVWIGLLGGIFGVLVGGIACIFGISIAAVAIEGACFVMGAALVGIGIANVFSGLPAVGLIVIALGMLFLALAVLGLVALMWTVGRALPWILRAVVRLCKRPFQKRGASI